MSDSLRALGIPLFLVFFLVLSSVPGLVVPYAHRDGYSRTEAEVLSPEGARQRSIEVRIAGGQALSVLRSSFDGATQGARLAVWYNPNARLRAGGINWYDYRLISAARYPDHVEGAVVAGWLAALMILGALSGYLIFGGREPGPSKRKKG